MSSIDKPQIHLNLDNYKTEANAEPFGFVLNGKRYEFINAGDLDAFEFFENALRGEAYATTAVIEAALGDDPDAYADFKKAGLRLRQMQHLVRNYFEHGGIQAGN